MHLLSQPTNNPSFCLAPRFHCLVVDMCMGVCASLHVCVHVCVVVPDPAALQTSTDVSGGPVGSHSIEEAPGSSEAFSLPLGSVWAAQQTPSPHFLPQPSGPSLRQNYKGPPTAGSSLCVSPPLPFAPPPPPPPRNPRPASISRRYSIHRRRALITKQDYGPCLGTTCQGACSLLLSLHSSHTSERGLFVCFWEGDRWFDFLKCRHGPNH